MHGRRINFRESLMSAVSDTVPVVISNERRHKGAWCSYKECGAFGTMNVEFVMQVQFSSLAMYQPQKTLKELKIVRGLGPIWDVVKLYTEEWGIIPDINLHRFYSGIH